MYLTSGVSSRRWRGVSSAGRSVPASQIHVAPISCSCQTAHTEASFAAARLLLSGDNSTGGGSTTDGRHLLVILLAYPAPPPTCAAATEVNTAAYLCRSQGLGRPLRPPARPLPPLRPLLLLPSSSASAASASGGAAPDLRPGGPNLLLCPPMCYC